jgi:hypothetical protein
LDTGKRSISSYSLIIIGLFLLLFGALAGMYQKSSGNSTEGGLVLLFEVLFPPPGTVLYHTDFTWNIIGALLLSSGLLFYKYTREKAVQHPRIRTAAVVVTSILFFYGLFALRGGLFFHYEYCYLPGAAFLGFDCGNIFTFSPVMIGILYTLIGSISFAGVTVSNLSIARLR